MFDTIELENITSSSFIPYDKEYVLSRVKDYKEVVDSIEQNIKEVKENIKKEAKEKEEKEIALLLERLEKNKGIAEQFEKASKVFKEKKKDK